MTLDNLVRRREGLEVMIGIGRVGPKYDPLFCPLTEYFGGLIQSSILENTDWLLMSEITSLEEPNLF